MFVPTTSKIRAFLHFLDFNTKPGQQLPCSNIAGLLVTQNVREVCCSFFLRPLQPFPINPLSLYCKARVLPGAL